MQKSNSGKLEENRNSLADTLDKINYANQNRVLIKKVDESNEGDLPTEKDKK